MDKAKRAFVIDGKLILCCMRGKENFKENFETLEVCLISNLQTKAISESHPIDKIFAAGVKTTINTDNNTISNTSLIDEYRYVLDNTDLTIEDIKRMNVIAVEAAFITEKEKSELVEKIKEQI